MKYCFFDCETTGKPASYKAPVTDGANWPRLVQVAWLTGDGDNLASDVRDRWVDRGPGGRVGVPSGVDPADVQCRIVRPDGFVIPQEASDIHGITTAHATVFGQPLDEVLMELYDDAAGCELLVGHNVDFDRPIIGAELVRVGLPTVASQWMAWPSVCTMKLGTDLCKLPGRYGYKWPKLEELYRHLFGRGFEGAHRADQDMVATAECFFEMLRRGLQIQVDAKAALDRLS